MKPQSTWVFDDKFYRRRKQSRTLRYSLQRRTQEILAAIKEYHPQNVESIIDLGAADGLMLSNIKREYPQARCVGVDCSPELVDIARQNTALEIYRWDVQDLRQCFSDNSFDVAVSAGVISYLPSPYKMFSESFRILKRGGILVLTSPDPMWGKIAESIGHVEKGNLQSLNLKRLARVLSEIGFDIILTKKFMFSPVGFLLETYIERAMILLRLDFLLYNQLVVGKKPSRGS